MELSADRSDYHAPPRARRSARDGIELSATGIAHWATTKPDTGALIHGAREVVTFSELERRQAQLAGWLMSEGIAPGDRVAVVANNHPVVVEIVGACLRAEFVPVPVNASLTEGEVAYILDDSEARWLFTDRAMELRPNLEKVVVLGDAYERSLAEATETPLAEHVRGRPMHYTSGTTGKPKGVLAPIVSEDEAAQRSEAFIATWGLEPEDVHLVVSPLAHSAPLRFALRTLEAGGSVVILDRFEPKAVLAAIELFGVTTTFMVPTHLQRILNLGRRKLARYDLHRLRLVAHAGAPMPRKTKRAALRIFPPGSVWEFYGSTEGQFTRISPEEWENKPDSVGRAYEGAKVYVMSEDFEPLPRGEVGRVWVLDPNAEPFEYWGDRAKTDAAWRDGAYHVGDLGYLDEDGFLFLQGRADDTIITGGVNVYPAEIEAVLIEHPDVAHVLVYGVESEEWGQEVRAAIVPKGKHELDVDALTTWAKERLAGFKVPKVFEIVSDLPTTATGKPARKL